MARITGSVGGALASLSFDQDYKRVIIPTFLGEMNIHSDKDIFALLTLSRKVAKMKIVEFATKQNKFSI